MDVNLKSWEARWAEYLEELAAAEARRVEQEEQADDDDAAQLTARRSTARSSSSSSTPPGNFGPAASARSTKPVGDVRDALESTRSRMFDDDEDLENDDDLEAIDLNCIQTVHTQS